MALVKNENAVLGRPKHQPGTDFYLRVDYEEYPCNYNGMSYITTRVSNLMALSHSDALHQRMPTYVNFHQDGGVR